MSVTPEVSQLETSALKFKVPVGGKRLKSMLMSVMPETHQSAMGPYFAMAEAAFELNSVTAVFREALVVKVFWVVQATTGGASVTMPMQSGVLEEGAKTTRPLLVVVAPLNMAGPVVGMLTQLNALVTGSKIPTQSAL